MAGESSTCTNAGSRPGSSLRLSINQNERATRDLCRVALGTNCRFLSGSVLLTGQRPAQKAVPPGALRWRAAMARSDQVPSTTHDGLPCLREQQPISTTGDDRAISEMVEPKNYVVMPGLGLTWSGHPRLSCRKSRPGWPGHGFPPRKRGGVPARP